MEYLLSDQNDVMNMEKDLGRPVYAGNGITVECFHLRPGTTVMVDNDEPSYAVGEPRTVCYLCVRGELEFWLGEEKVPLLAGGSITLFPRERFSIWAKEDSFFYVMHNKVEPGIDNTPAELVKAVKSVELKDRYLQGHNYRVGKYSTLIMQILAPEKATASYYLAAAYHDVGKTVVPEEILNKNGRLTPEEFDRIKEHSAASYELLRKHLGDTAASYARWHHEKLDGSGYPDGLQGDAIPLESRVMAVADIFDALTTARCYRTAFSFPQALAIMQKDAAAGKIDESVLQVLIRLVEDGKIVEGVDNLVTVAPKD